MKKILSTLILMGCAAVAVAAPAYTSNDYAVGTYNRDGRAAVGVYERDADAAVGSTYGRTVETYTYRDGRAVRGPASYGAPGGAVYRERVITEDAVGAPAPYGAPAGAAYKGGSCPSKYNSKPLPVDHVIRPEPIDHVIQPVNPALRPVDPSIQPLKPPSQTPRPYVDGR